MGDYLRREARLNELQVAMQAGDKTAAARAALEWAIAEEKHGAVTDIQFTALGELDLTKPNAVCRSMTSAPPYRLIITFGSWPAAEAGPAGPPTVGSRWQHQGRGSVWTVLEVNEFGPVMNCGPGGRLIQPDHSEWPGDWRPVMEP